MDESTCKGIPTEDRRQVWLRRWERTVPLLAGAISANAAIVLRLLNPTAFMLVMVAFGACLVLVSPSHWSRSYRPAEDMGSFFARELTTGDHLLSLCLWGLGVAFLMIWSSIAPHAPAELNQMVLGMLFFSLGMLLAKCLFPGQTAGLLARAGDERYSNNQAIAVSTLHATYHGAMWQMERRGEPIEE